MRVFLALWVTLFVVSATVAIWDGVDPPGREELGYIVKVTGVGSAAVAAVVLGMIQLWRWAL